MNSHSHENRDENMGRVRRICHTLRVVLYWGITLIITLKALQTPNWLFWGVAALAVVLGCVQTANWLISKTSSRIFSSVDNIPARKVGLVLGNSEYINGRLNPVLTGRLQAAASLYHAGKVKMLVVSGASRPEEHYDEISAMTRGLVARGVPEDAIIGDGRGIRTLDSILRMRDIFGFDDFITISQRDHCERALFLADHHGISTIGFEAGILPPELYMQERIESAIRVPLANVKALLDIAIKQQAKYPTER